MDHVKPFKEATRSGKTSPGMPRGEFRSAYTDWAEPNAMFVSNERTLLPVGSSKYGSSILTKSFLKIFPYRPTPPK
ncbi:MAG: hypothetical protein P4L46_19240 [Fimbriimonas sp.]|nr:hypothetical protein [Fimbriimonas sp.]